MARDEAYREAERRIEAARLERATELDLSGMGLTELPEAIGSITQLFKPEPPISTYRILHTHYIKSNPDRFREICWNYAQ